MGSCLYNEPMRIKRLDTLSRFLQPEHRCHILYGPGVLDVFHSDGRELDFCAAVEQTLKRAGFSRVIFYSAGQQIRNLPLPEPPALSREDDAQGVMTHLHNGPLRDLVVIPKITQLTTSYPLPGAVSGMGDTHAVRLLDTLMRGADPVAVVVLQAETTLRFNSDQRTLSALVGGWFNLPTNLRSRAFFVFSSPDRKALKESAAPLAIPELRQAVQNESGLIVLPTPCEDELADLIGGRASTEERARLIGVFAAEGVPLRVWSTRLQAVEKISMQSARENGWLSSRTGDEPAMLRLDRMAGLQGVRDRVRELADWLSLQSGFDRTPETAPLLHMIFSGNPGTGKTTVARLLGEILQELGYLKRGHLVEVKAGDLVAEYVGGTAQKTNAVIDRALDGVLFIDEAYTLADTTRGGFGREAIDTLLVRLENDRHHLVVIAAGYPDRMIAFLQSNPGLSRRFPAENRLLFPDYTPEERLSIFMEMLSARQLHLEPQVDRDRLLLMLRTIQDNAGGIRNLVDGLERRRASRVVQNRLPHNAPLISADFSGLAAFPDESSLNLDQLLADFNNLVGLETVKEQIRKEAGLARFSVQRAVPSLAQSARHLVFLGNPGTGKTTVARLLGQIYRKLGVLRSGHVVEVSRADLVAGYVGQTADRTRLKVQEALGGILFIDEAYSLSRDHASDFGREAVDTLVKLMEDHRQQFIVIAAGYPQEMKAFLRSNPGFESRFAGEIRFDNFSSVELVEILRQLADNDQILLPPESEQAALRFLQSRRKSEGKRFGNARSVRQLYQAMLSNLACREQSSSGQVSFLPDDVPAS